MNLKQKLNNARGYFYWNSELYFMGLFITFLVAVTLLVAPGIMDDYDQSKANFMRQCLEDHKEYFCKALWRGAY